MCTYTIRENPEFKSLEVIFPVKPADQVIEALKGLRFRWHKVKKLWYGFINERELTDAINAATREAQPEAVATGGVVGDGYMGGGEWTGCNYDTHKYLSYGEINKLVKKELKRLYPDATFKTRGKSYSGGQSSILYIQLPSDVLFVDRDLARDIFADQTRSAVWLTLKNRDVRASEATREEFDEAFEVQYSRMMAKYEHGAHNVKDYLTPEARAILSKAKALYSSYIHDESNSMVDYFDRSLYDSYYVCNLDHAGRREKWEV